MKVGFLLLHPYSFTKTKSLATTVRVKELARSLSTLGVEVYVFTPYEKSYETPEGIRIIGLNNLWLKLGLAERVYGFSREVYHKSVFHKILARYFLKRTLTKPSKPFFQLFEAVDKYEIDILQAIQESAALWLLGVKKELELPLAVDLHTLWPEEAVATGAIKRDSKEFKILHDIEEQILQAMDLIIALGEKMYNHVLLNYQVERRKIVIVPPGARPLLNDVPRRTPPPKVLYSGIVSRRKNFKLYLDAIPYVNSKQASTKFYATKKGDLINWARSYAKKRNIKNLTWYWFPNADQFFAFMEQCHVGVITNENSEANKMDMPSKLFDYMCLGVPVATNYIGGGTNIVEQYRVGITTKSTPKSFAEGILTLLENPELAYKCGKNGIELIKERFNWDISAKKLYQRYLALKNENRSC